VLRNADLSATQKVVAIATVHEASWAASAGKPIPRQHSARPEWFI